MHSDIAQLWRHNEYKQTINMIKYEKQFNYQ